MANKKAHKNRTAANKNAKSAQSARIEKSKGAKESKIKNEVEQKPVSAGSKLVYITRDNGEFYETQGKLLGLKLDGVDRGRVALLRMFPFTTGEDYLSVRDADSKEIGVIENIGTFPAEQIKFVRAELARRYFEPDIVSINSVKEEFGYTYWDVVTTSGTKNFAVFDMNNNLNNLGGGALMLTDVDGSRYRIPDYTALPVKALRHLEIWI